MSALTKGKVIVYKPNFNVNPVDTLLDLPVLGAENTLYVIKDTGAIYLWNGSEFIIYDSRPYKVYTALLTQGGTDAPVATVLENTLGGVPVWSYDGVGSYRITLIDSFNMNKTAIITSNSIENNNSGLPGALIRNEINNDYITFFAMAADGITYDDWLDNYTIEIRVYP